MPELDRLSDKVRRTRRNFVKISAIGVSVVFAALYCSQRAIADPDDDNHPCFLKGMRVRTVDGDREIQDLTIGDRVPTVFNGTRLIKAISSYSLKNAISRGPGTRACCR